MAMMLEDRSCALCGPAAAKDPLYPSTFVEEHVNAVTYSARRSPDKIHFRIVRCRGCGMLFSDPALDGGSLAALYKDSAVTYGRQEAEIFESYRPVLDRALPCLKRRGAFVEIGGGRGFMLDYGHEKGFDSLIEVEPSSEAGGKFDAKGRNARFIESVFKEGTLSPGTASLVCFFQMLDHVPDPAAFLAEVYRALEPGGVAVCVTHNTQAWSARVLRSRSPIFDIEHTYLFAPENLSKLLSKTGFVEVETFPIANRYSLGYWMHIAPIPRAIKALMSRFFEATGLSGWKINLYAGNFAAIARKPSE